MGPDPLSNRRTASEPPHSCGGYPAAIDPTARPEGRGSVFDRRPWLPLAGLTLLGLALYTPGLGWGIPATVSWSQDTIAGVRTLGAVEHWPEVWLGRYPPLHYLVLYGVYRPVLSHWRATGQLVTGHDTGEEILTPPQATKIGLLLLLARGVSVVAGIVAGLGLYAATRRLLDDPLAATLAAAALMAGAAFTYFAHLGNVDVPSLAWFCWSVYFYVRLLDSGRSLDAALLGLLASAAISTKDPLAGAYPGMAVVLLVEQTRRLLREHRLPAALLRALLRPPWLLGLACFAIPYLWLYGAFSNPHAYLDRLRYWLTPAAESLHARQVRYDTTMALIGAMVRYAAGAVGWPMLAAIVVSTVLAVRRWPRPALVVLLPAATYVLTVIVPIRFVYSRFLLAPLALSCILLGKAASTFCRASLLPAGLKAAVVAAVVCLSLGYAAAIDAELLTDSRYAAERWFEQNVPRTATIGASSPPQYLPRLPERGYRTYSVEMTRDAFDHPQPEYLLLSSYDYEDYDVDQRTCMNDLVAGRLGYEVAATFRGRFLGTGRSWLALAGWGAPVPGKISPTIIILRRAARSSS